MENEPTTETFLTETECQLRRFAFTMGLSSHDAEDVVQEAMIRFARATEGGRAIRNRKAYIFSIVRNCTLSKLRNRVRRNEVELVDDHPDDVAPESVYASPQLAEAFRTAYAELAQPDRELVRKRYMEGWTLSALGAELGCTPQNIYKRLSKIITKTLSGHVRSALDQLDPDLSKELFNA